MSYTQYLMKLFFCGLAFVLVSFTMPYTFAQSFPSKSVEKVNCPSFKDKKELAATFVSADGMGARLSSQSQGILRQCFAFEDLIAWDYFYVIKDFSVNECEQKSQKCVSVKFNILGKLYTNSKFEAVQKNYRKKILEININQDTMDRFSNQEASSVPWKISKMDSHPPHLLKAEAVKFLNHLEKQIGAASTTSDQSWIKKAIQDISATE